MTRFVPLLGLAVALVLTVAFWFLLYRPADLRQAELTLESDGLVAQQQALRNQVAALTDVSAREPELRADLERLSKALPGRVGQPTLLRQLQRSADAAGVEIASATFGLPEPVAGAPAGARDGKALARVPVTFAVKGGYFQAVDLLRRFERETPRAVDVDAVSMTESEAGFPDLATTVTGAVFALLPPPAQEPPAPGATDTPAAAAQTAPAAPAQDEAAVR